MSGNPDLYVTKFPTGNKSPPTGYEDYEYFINNAKVVLANQKGKTTKGKDQVPSKILNE